jgi:hypothetical protein
VRDLSVAHALGRPPSHAELAGREVAATLERVAARARACGHQFLAHEWDLDGDGQFDDGNERLDWHSYPAGEHVVRLRVRYLNADGTHVDVAERTITVGEPQVEPTPVPTPQATPNQPPVAALEKSCSRKAGMMFCAGLFAREHKPHTLDASPSHDPDGSIVRHEWDLDGTGGFERDTGASPTVTHTFEAYKGLVDNRKRPVRVRVTDDKGDDRSQRVRRAVSGIELIQRLAFVTGRFDNQLSTAVTWADLTRLVPERKHRCRSAGTAVSRGQR